MPTLRDHTKEALSATEPTEQEAQEALRAVIEQAHANKPSRSPGWLMVPAFAGVAVVVYLVAFRPTPKATEQTQTEQTARRTNHGVHLYLRSTHEPEAYALSLDLNTQGER